MPSETRLMIGHPTGNQFFRHLVTTLASTQHLAWAGTCLTEACMPQWLRHFLPAGSRRELSRRRFDLPGVKLVHAHPAKELWRLACERLPVRFLRTWSARIAGIDTVYRDFDQWMASQCDRLRPTHVYAYEDAALHVFEYAASQNIRRIYDLPIAHWPTLRHLLTEQAERLPQWTATLAGGIHDPQEKLERKSRELELADLVVVPSGFVAQSLPASRPYEVCISPFGSPAIVSTQAFEHVLAERQQRTRQGKPLRVLFVGSMSQRKGLADLMSAVNQLSTRQVQLVVLGSLQADRAFYERSCPGFTWERGRPHNEVLQLMRSCDLFCLPSIVEGRALVIQEAMSQGLPVIITENTGASDVVLNESQERSAGVLGTTAMADWTRGQTGFIVPPGRHDSIAEVIQWAIDHRVDLETMSIAARSRAAEYTWNAYGNTILSAIEALTMNALNNR